MLNEDNKVYCIVNRGRTTFYRNNVFCLCVFFLDWDECIDPLYCYKQSCGDNPVEIKKIDVGNNRSVSLYSLDCSWPNSWFESSVPIYYQVLDTDKLLVPLTFISFYDPNYVERIAVKIIYANEQSLVGICTPNSCFYDQPPILYKDPYPILIDFKTGESWPGHAKIKAEGLVKRLQQENPNLIILGFPPTPTPIFTPPPAKPTPTNTLVVQPTYYNTPQTLSTNSP